MLKRIISIQLFVVLLNLLFISSATAKNSQVRITNKPDWVVGIKPDTNLSNLSKDSYGGYYYLLLDVQENIPKETIYCHYALKLFNSDGVQNMSDISVDFDPGFQTLTFHEINRFRNGIRTNEMLNHKIKIIQREPDMERFLYDGRLTAFVNLEDIRDGDIIEYSYSLEGYNPIYKGNYFRSLNMEYSDPLKEIYRRIISSKSRKLFINYPNGKVESEIHEVNNTLEYLWQARDVKSHIYDNNVPAWFNNNLRIEISTIDNWSDVARLCLENYKVSPEEQSRLEKMAAELFGHLDKDSLLMPVIHFVQDDIRYLGFESGLNAYKPMQPGKVMESRYADCKAKSLLLCNLLKLYGIEAYPVLVNSNRIKYDSLAFPSPDIFNHCVVQVSYRDHIINIDPTISGQGGGMDNFFIPDYGYGLVLKEGTSALSHLANNCKSETRVNNSFKIDSIGGTVSYNVITDYTGYYADDIRSSFRNKSDDETTKSYLKFYSKTYPMIRSAAPLKYLDDRNRNLFRVEEKYLIDSMWVPAEDDPDKLELSLAALVINSAVSIPSSPERTMPYLITYPSSYFEDIYIDLPKEWAVKPDKKEIKDPLFSFSYISAYTDKKIHLQYNYTTFGDFQQGKTFKEFYSKHQKISDNLYYSLSYDLSASSPFKFSWTIAFCYFIVLIISIFFAVQLYRNFNLQITAPDSMELGGWLFLIALGLIISTFKVANNLFFSTGFFDEKTWTTYLQPGNTNIPLFILICFEFVYNSVLLVFIILLIVLFFKRRNTLPRLIIIFYAANVFFLIFDTVVAYSLAPDNYTISQKNKSYVEIGQSLVVSIIWITYFLNSKRVKATFTRISEVRPGGFAASVDVSEPDQHNYLN
jgi:hypothetical protein